MTQYRAYLSIAALILGAVLAEGSDLIPENVRRPLLIVEIALGALLTKKISETNPNGTHASEPWDREKTKRNT